MDAYRAIVNMFANTFAHPPDTDMNEMRQRVDNCLTVDNNDTREMWNVLINENLADITVELYEISNCIHHGLHMTHLLTKRVWEFVYRNAVHQTSTNTQQFEQTNQLRYIHTTLYMASCIQHLQGGAFLPGLDDFRFFLLNNQQTEPRGYNRSSREAWTNHITTLHNILQRYRDIRRNAKRIMARPRNYRFAFIVAHIVDMAGEMISDWVERSIQHAETSIAQIGTETTRTRKHLDDDIVPGDDEDWSSDDD